ncbi:MAG: protein kinase domain-containing protein, partial [Lentisphaeria bacterium]
EFIRQKYLPRWSSAAYRSWESAKSLDQFAIGSASYLSWLQIKNGNDYIILEDLGKDNYYFVLKQNVENDSFGARELLQQLATMVSTLHDFGIFHRDLKTDNFMIKNGTLKLIDLDRVRFYQNLPKRNIIRNFEQILATMPKEISKFSLLRLASYYRDCRGLSAGELRKILKIMDNKK